MSVQTQGSPEFGRVITAMVTPFDRETGEIINYRATQELVNHLENNGSDSLVVAGTTGESGTITHEEQIDLISAVHAFSSIPVIAGTGSNNTKEAVELTRKVAEEKIADGILAISPYCNRPPQGGIEHYFRSLAEAAGNLPVIMYDIPVRTGRKIASEVIIRLAKEVPNIVGLKDAAGDPQETARVIVETPDEFIVYSGDDSLNLELFRLGAVGAISVASHWAGNVMQEMFKAEEARNMRLAEKLDNILKESYEFETGDLTPNPHPAKAMMRLLGFDVGYCRPPMRLSVYDGDNARLEQQLRADADNVYFKLRQDAKAFGIYRP